MSAYILWVPQLSNYNTDGQFILTADSNWQIFALKAREMIKFDPALEIDVIVPLTAQCLEDVNALLIEHGLQDNVTPIRIPIKPQALVTRFDFPWNEITARLEHHLPHYTHVYVNDPMLVRHYKALFYINGKLTPKFIVQTHFLDSPVARIVDDPISYWHGTVEACLKSDVVLWHCRSMEKVFEEAVRQDYKDHIVDAILAKSDNWKDGLSTTEINQPVNMANLRFDPALIEQDNRVLVWVPNRVGGLGKSFDYTNNGKFLFDIVPEIWKQRQDFWVVAGNPNQKITNDEISALCPAYLKLVPGALNRDEYRWMSAHAELVVGLYTNDTNGGLASLEAIEHNALPLFPDIYEYKVYFDAVGWPQDMRIKPDLSDAAEVMSRMLDLIQDPHAYEVPRLRDDLREFVRRYASYECTTPVMMRKLFGY